jgi:hypothetical protein
MKFPVNTVNKPKKIIKATMLKGFKPENFNYRKRFLLSLKQFREKKRKQILFFLLFFSLFSKKKIS